MNPGDVEMPDVIPVNLVERAVAPAVVGTVV
jgi:hypothetical protein